DAGDGGVERPAFPGRIACEAARHHKAGDCDRAETDETSNAVNGAVERLRAVAMRPHRIAQARIGHEKASNNETKAENAQQQWPANRSPASLQDLSEPDSEEEHKRSTDEEIRNLHPALIAQAERTDEIMPRTITRTGSSFNQKYQDEEDRTKCATCDQESREFGVVLCLTVFCSKHSIFLFLYLIDLIEEVYPHQLCLTSVHRPDSAPSLVLLPSKIPTLNHLDKALLQLVGTRTGPTTTNYYLINLYHRRDLS